MMHVLQPETRATAGTSCTENAELSQQEGRVQEGQWEEARPCSQHQATQELPGPRGLEDGSRDLSCWIQPWLLP